MPVVRELLTRLGYKIDDKDLNKYDKQTGQLTGKLKSLGVAAAAAGVALAGMITAKLIKGVFDTNVEFESLFANLKTATGSAAEADKVFARLEKFATTTPFQLNEVVQAFIKLKNLGIDPSERALTSFGNTASSQSKPLNQLIEAVADAATGQFDRLPEFGITAKTLGDKVAFTFKGITTTVGKNAKEITEFLIGLGEQNFAGSMAEQMLTLGGFVSNLRDGIDKFFRTAGKAGANDAFRELLQTFVLLQGSTDGVAVSFGQVLASAIRRVNALIKLGIAHWNDIKAASEKAFDIARVLPFVLVVEDFIGFLQGKDSVIGELFDRPEVQDFIGFLQQMRAEVLPEFIALFIELGTEIKNLALAVFPELAEQGDGSLEVILKGLKLLIVGFFLLARFTIQALTLIIQAAEFFAPAFLFIFDGLFGGVITAISFLLDVFKFFFDAVLFGWDFVVNQFSALLNLLTGDVDGAIANWTASLKGFTDLLGSIGIDISDITGQAAGGGVGGTQVAAVAAAGGTTGGKGDTSNTASVGSVSITQNIGGTQGPDEISKATSGGVTSGLDKLLKDMNRNSAGATT